VKKIPIFLLHFLFPKVKPALKGKRFQDAEGIKENVTAELNAVPLQAFADSSQKLLKRFNKCIQVDGEITFNRNKTIFYFLVYFIFFFTPARELCRQTHTHRYKGFAQGVSGRSG
jgi:hypothetical protein